MSCTNRGQRQFEVNQVVVVFPLPKWCRLLTSQPLYPKVSPLHIVSNICKTRSNASNRNNDARQKRKCCILMKGDAWVALNMGHVWQICEVSTHAPQAAILQLHHQHVRPISDRATLLCELLISSFNEQYIHKELYLGNYRLRIVSTFININLSLNDANKLQFQRPLNMYCQVIFVFYKILINVFFSSL